MGALTLRNIHIWQADSLARTVWNSTLSFKDPSDSDLIKAWTLAPGNAQYWTWMASRVSQNPEMSLQIEQAVKNGEGGNNIHLLGQGILRNPTAWNLWRDLSWAAFLKASQGAEVLFPFGGTGLFSGLPSSPFFLFGVSRFRDDRTGFLCPSGWED